MSFARLDDQPVVSLMVVKKAGENLLSATDKIFQYSTTQGNQAHCLVI
jgi:hypothetical protein